MVKHKAFSPSILLDILMGLPRARAYWVALSGGADSVALLHSLAEIRTQLPAPLRAIHVNHGLQAQASAWAGFCRDLCLELQISCEVVSVDIERSIGESLEATARHARYQAIRNYLGAGEAVITAHHQDDQAETVLLHLIKGAGASGLAAMPAWRSFGSGFLFRPLLSFRQEQLRDWLSKENVAWVEDESNKNLRYDRNYLRHEILPRLEERRPGVISCLARSAAHQASQRELNIDLAKLDLVSVGESLSGTLAINKLLKLTPARRNNLLYWWLRNRGVKVIPSQRQLEALYQDVLLAGSNAHPELKMGDVLLRRHQNSLYKTMLREYPPIDVEEWKLNGPLELPQHGLYLEPQTLLRIFSEFDASTVLTIRFRQSGERFKPVGNSHTRSFKHLFQAWRVPAWKRDRVGLIYHQEELVMILGYARVDSLQHCA